MSAISALLMAYMGAFCIGLGVGVCLGVAVRLVKGITQAVD